MLGAGVTSVLFGISRSYWLFVMSWAALRFFQVRTRRGAASLAMHDSHGMPHPSPGTLGGMQPAGWPGVVKVAGQWVPPSRQGFVLGVLSLSFLGGTCRMLCSRVDGGCSWLLTTSGWQLHQVMSWRGRFSVSWLRLAHRGAPSLLWAASLRWPLLLS